MARLEDLKLGACVKGVLLDRLVRVVHEMSGWRRWIYGTPTQGNANYACANHFNHQMAHTAFAGFVFANGFTSST